MDGMDKAHKIIDQIDAQMAALFEQRMAVCADIAAYKKEHGLSVRDAAREAVVIENNRQRVTNPEVEPHYVRFLHNVINLSCDYQTALMAGMRVAYSGVEGAYAQIAGKRLFPEAELVAYPTFADAYYAAESGACDCAVLPIENSYAGEVGTVMDLLFSGELFINQVLDLPISHCLMGVPGAKLEDVTTVISHTQALEQCSRLIRDRGLMVQARPNTALAAKEVAEGGDPSIAAIASEETAALFGLDILARQINDSTTNTTRFAVFSQKRSAPTSARKREDENFILVFTVRNEAGALAQALNIIGAHGFNMRALRSRPMKDLQWNYYFYIEAEGSILSQDGEDMLRELSVICARLRLAGVYYAMA